MNNITLTNIHDFTLQQVFDRVATHLLTQGQPAMIDDPTMGSSCVYRSNDGLMCAVGCLISDEEYTPTLEQNGILAEVFDDYFRPFERSPEAARLFNEELAVDADPHRKLLVALQEVHDDAWEPDLLPARWTRDLKAVASNFNLSIEALEQYL